ELEADAEASFHRLAGVPGWTGLERVLDGGAVVTRAVQWNSRTRRLLEVVILSDPADPEDAHIVETLLDSLEVVCRGEEETRWALFELDVQTPERWRLERARVRPADVTFHFVEEDVKGRPTRNETWVRRRGMADAWYGGDGRKLL